MTDPTPAHRRRPVRSRRFALVLAIIVSLAPAAGCGAAPDADASPLTSAKPEPAVAARAAPTSSSDYPTDLFATGVYREALLLQPGADESRTWDVLDRAAVTDTPVVLEIAVPAFPGRISEPKRGLTSIDIPPRSTDPTQAARDERGGVGFSIVIDDESLTAGCPYGSFHRISGSYRVTREVEAGRSVFRLTGGAGEAAELPEGLSDDKRCKGTAGRAETLQLVEQTARTLTDENYAEVKSQWMASPRVWWAIRDQRFANDGGDAITDPLLEACWPWEA